MSISRWSTIDIEDGEQVPYNVMEVETGVDEMVRIQFGPRGFILPAISSRPWTVTEIMALHAMLGEALEVVNGPFLETAEVVQSLDIQLS